MRFSVQSLAAALGVALVLGAALPAYAAGDAGGPAPAMPAPAVSPVGAMDPALKRALAGVATMLLTDFAGSMATGNLESFDPGPALERTLKGILARGDLDRLIDGLVAQAVAGSGSAASDVPPELRAALALAAKGMIANVRREMAREFGRQ